jgi:hypothetical protein
MQSPNVPHPGPLPASQGERANGRTRHGSGLPGGWQPGEGEGGSGLLSLMPSSPYSPIYAHSSAHRMPRARICSLEYRESAQWGAAATKSRRWVAALAQQSGLLPHDREDRPRLPPVALYHTFELGAPIRRHAQTIDDEVFDPVHVVVPGQAPIDSDRPGC